MPSPPRRRAAALAVAALAVWTLTGCTTGTSCDELPDVRAERDAARTDYLALVRSGTATPEETGEADDRVHELDRRAYDLEQACG